jgi:hypothetical protein
VDARGLRLVGDFGSGQALSDDQFRLLEPFITPAKPGGRPRTTDMRRLLDGLSMSCTHWLSMAPRAAAPSVPAVADDLNSLYAIDKRVLSRLLRWSGTHTGFRQSHGS